MLKFSKFIDAISVLLGRVAMVLILAAVVISASNAVMRKAFSIGSNAYLEIQWYLFAGVFLLGAGYVFLKNGHVRIDFISSRLSERTNAIIDIIGILLIVTPFTLVMIDLGWPIFSRAFSSGETSQNAGGLIRWPVFLLIPLGFGLLLLQALSELIKRIAFLTGARAEPFSVEKGKSAEELLAEELAAEAQRKLMAQLRP